MYNRFNTNSPPRSIAIRSLPEPTITSNLKNGYFLNIFFFSSAYIITEESKRILNIYINRYIIILSEKTTCLTNEIYVNVQDVLKNFQSIYKWGQRPWTSYHIRTYGHFFFWLFSCFYDLVASYNFLIAFDLLFFVIFQIFWFC